MRKLLVGLVMACVTLGLVAPAADAKESLSGRPKKQIRKGRVTYSGTTSCRRVYLRSNPGGSKTALVPQTKSVRAGRFSFVKLVRSRAAFRKYKVVAHCNNRKGRVIGRVNLEVVPSLPVSGGPVLPQLLLGTGLLAAGGLLLLVGRRRWWGYARRLAAWGPAVPRDSRP